MLTETTFIIKWRYDMKCIKCGKEPQPTDKIAWKCNTCGKTYNSTSASLHNIQNKKNSTKADKILRCKNCGEYIDDGNEKIYWNCSCGNINCGNLEEYVGKSNHNKLITCPACGKEISSKAKKCVHCGNPIKGRKNRKTNKIIIGIVSGIALIAVVFMVLINSNPISKYNFFFNQDKSEQAIKIYNEKIDGNKQLEEELSDKQNQEMDNIYQQFKEGKISFNYAEKKIQKYTQYLPSKNYALEIKSDIESLDDSRTSFENAQKAEEGGDIENALTEYGKIIEDDASYSEAQKKIYELQKYYKNQLLKEAKSYIKKKKYDKAIKKIDKIISVLGSSDDLTELKEKYKKMKSVQYVKIVVADKTVTPKDADNWIFSNYVNFVFNITNNSNKAIKGIEGILTVNDLFGKKILDIGCDFTGHTIKLGETYTETDMRFECNEFIQEHMKLFNTDYSDLKFQYNITKIIYIDGTSVVPK